MSRREIVVWTCDLCNATAEGYETPDGWWALGEKEYGPHKQVCKTCLASTRTVEETLRELEIGGLMKNRVLVTFEDDNREKARQAKTEVERQRIEKARDTPGTFAHATKDLLKHKPLPTPYSHRDDDDT